MTEYIVIILIVVLFGLLFITKKNNNNSKHNNKDMPNKIVNFKSYASVLLYFLDKSYDIIYKDKMLVYSIEGMKIDNDDFGGITKQFSILVLKMLGPNLKEEFTSLFGDEETLIFNIIEYFNTRFEDDEIRDKAKENLFTDIDGNSLIQKEDIQWMKY